MTVGLMSTQRRVKQRKDIVSIIIIITTTTHPPVLLEGSIFINFSALAASLTTKVTKNRLVRALNLTFSGFFLMVMARQSLRVVNSRNSLMSVTCFGCLQECEWECEWECELGG